jgi:hypothetical protein
MKHRFVRLLTVPIVVVLGLSCFALLAAGCGGGKSADGSPSSRPLTLGQYFQQLGEADNMASARFAQIRTQLGQQQPEAETLRTLQDVYPEEVVTLEDLVESMEALGPPAEVKDVHDAAVAALKNSAVVARKNTERIQSAASAQQATDLLSGQETTQANERTTSTCLALEKAGTDRGITVDLDC